MHELEGFFYKTVVSGIKSKFAGTGKKRHGPNQQAGPTDGQKNKRRALGCAHTGPGPGSGEVGRWGCNPRGWRGAVNAHERAPAARTTRRRGAILLCPSCCRIDAAKETRGWRGLARRNITGTTGSRAGRLDGK